MARSGQREVSAGRLATLVGLETLRPMGGPGGPARHPRYNR